MEFDPRMDEIKFMKGFLYPMSLSVLLSGCGSLATLLSSDSYIERNLERRNTYCSYIPRVYSGVVYDMCKLHAKPKNSYSDPTVFMFVGLDLMLSGAVDTLVLPYTMYQQSEVGSNHL